MKTNIEVAVETAEAEYNNVYPKFIEARDNLNAMKSKLHNAHDTNNAEIDARANAAVEGVEREEQPIIDVPKLTTDIAVQEKVVTALQVKVSDAKTAVQDARSGQAHATRMKARGIIVDRFGMSDTNKIKFNRISSLDDLMDLLALARVWTNGQHNLASLFEQVIQTETKADREASAERVKALLA